MTTYLHQTLDQLVTHITKLLEGQSSSWVMVPNSICDELCANAGTNSGFTQFEKKDGLWKIKEKQQ